MSEPTWNEPAWNERLDRIEAKLDDVAERQAFVEDLIREMTPVAREAVRAMSGTMQTWEERGWFRTGAAVVSLFDTVAQAYGPEDIDELSGHVVQLVATVRDLTRPEVLDLANRATEVLHHPGDVEPVGPLGVARATTDPDVQRGLALAIEVLRHVGRAADRSSSRSVEPSAGGAPRRAAAVAPAASPPATPAPTLAPQAVPQVVEWQGRRFSGDGFLLEPTAWDEALAAAMAAGLGLALTDDHWTAIRWARADFLTSGASPNVRRVASGSGLGTQRLYQLFPGTPGKTIAQIAGVPKPVGCV